MGIISPEVDPELAAVKRYGGTEKIITHFFINDKRISKKKARSLIDQVIRLDLFGFRHFNDYPGLRSPA